MDTIIYSKINGTSSLERAIAGARQFMTTLTDKPQVILVSGNDNYQMIADGLNVDLSDNLVTCVKHEDAFYFGAAEYVVVVDGITDGQLIKLLDLNRKPNVSFFVAN